MNYIYQSWSFWQLGINFNDFARNWWINITCGLHTLHCSKAGSFTDWSPKFWQLNKHHFSQMTLNWINPENTKNFPVIILWFFTNTNTKLQKNAHLSMVSDANGSNRTFMLHPFMRITVLQTIQNCRIIQFQFRFQFQQFIWKEERKRVQLPEEKHLEMEKAGRRGALAPLQDILSALAAEEAQSLKAMLCLAEWN